MLVAWTNPARDPRLEDAMGIGGSQAITDAAGRYWNVTGMVHLNGPAIGEWLDRPGGYERAVVVVVHELGHVVGLGHAPGDGQLMTESGSGSFTLADGDRRGLAQLANVPCNRQF